MVQHIITPPNMSEVRAQLNAAFQAVPVEGKAAMGAILAPAIKWTMERTPLGETGNLQSSISAESKVHPDGLGFTLRTSGIEYAAAQEANLDYRHINQEPSGERGPLYIYRGIRWAAEHAYEHLAEMHKRIWSKK